MSEPKSWGDYVLQEAQAYVSSAKGDLLPETDYFQIRLLTAILAELVDQRGKELKIALPPPGSVKPAPHVPGFYDTRTQEEKDEREMRLGSPDLPTTPPKPFTEADYWYNQSKGPYER